MNKAQEIFKAIAYEKLMLKDLEYCLSEYVKNEQYEECKLIKRLIDIKHYDTNCNIKFVAFDEFLLNIENFATELDGHYIFYNVDDEDVEELKEILDKSNMKSPEKEKVIKYPDDEVTKKLFNNFYTQ